MSWVRMNRYLILRRSVQISVMLLFVAGHAYDWKALQGNLSSSRIAGTIPLSDPYALLQTAFAGTLVGAEALLGGALVVAVFALIGGRVFCGWVCPMNIVTDFAENLRTAARTKTGMPSLTFSRNGRYWALGLGLVLSSIFGMAAFESISPVSALHRGIIYGMGAGWTLVVAVLLFDLFALRHGFCGHLCPLGGFYALVGGTGIVRVRHDEERCSRCMECVERCPEPQVLTMIGKESGFVTSGECTNCGRCIDVCRDRAMQFGAQLIAREHRKSPQPPGACPELCRRDKGGQIKLPPLEKGD